MKENICIYDREFKKLNHEYQNHVMTHNGQELVEGYKPDYVLADKDHYVILESENSSSRKLFVGGMVKAAHFLQHDKKGVLVFVIVEKNNTTVSAITAHLMKYYEWIKDKTGLYQIYVISTDDYFVNGEVLPIGSPDFLDKAYPVNIIKE